MFYAYIHESSTQDAPAFRTMDGGLKIFYDQSTLPTHPVPQTLTHNDLHCVFSCIPWALSRAGSLQNCGSAGSCYLKELLEFVSMGVYLIYKIYSFGSLM